MIKNKVSTMEGEHLYMSPVTPRRRLAFIPSGPEPPDSPARSRSAESVSRPAESAARSHSYTEPGRTPMSERQQLALLLQMTSRDADDELSDSTPGSVGSAPPPVSAGSTPSTPAQRRLHKRNERGETRLHVATIRGDWRQVRRLLGEGADCNASDFAGWTPLHEACIHGWRRIARDLLDAGADVNRPGLERVTPLHDAAGNGRRRLVRLLLRRGADTQITTIHGDLAVDLAATPEVRTLLQGDPGQLQDTSSEDETEEDAEEDKENRPTPASSTRRASRLNSRLSNSVNASVSVIMDSTVDSAGDLYDFKPEQEGDSVPERPLSSERKEEKREKAGSPAKAEEKGDDGKRPSSEMEEGDVEEGQKKKKKKGDDTPAKAAAKNGKGGEKAGKNGGKAGGAGGKSGKGYGSGSDRRSPTGSQAGANTSPKSKPASRTTSDDSDGDERREAGPKVPPLKIVINTTSSGVPRASVTGEQEQSKGKGGGAGSRLPYVVPSQTDTDPDDGVGAEQSSSGPAAAQLGEGAGEAGSPGGGSVGDKPATPARVTRSQRALQGSSGDAASPESAGGGGSTGAPDTERPPDEEDASEPPAPPPPPPPVAEHPRKRKIRQARATQQSETEDTASVSAANGGSAGNSGGPGDASAPPAEPPFMNNYKAYQEIRRQIDRRRRELFPITPKPPRGFKDYLINRATYVLAGNLQSRLSVPTMAPPASLAAGMKELFVDQEIERYKLRLQHIIEKEKLVLTVEQEILRVHGRAARALANQALPFSACTILRDEEVYNLATPEQEEKDRNVRDRYNGRQFFSWLQDVDDKWEKIKEGMVLRHINEAESLHAVQKMDWGWKLKEIGACDPRSTPKIDELHVPMVKVIDDFDMPPS